ncbi:hypothetical protein [Limosilactobacillus urinaemulieris]|uniref:hypothetical protein n=1 Tax=Limosilactobacillus urinaemulieris TaxID=2742600 RepID=UPI001F58ACA1|nr:hypothetical protein [Limosilactobacillus urinaemulieris]
MKIISEIIIITLLLFFFPAIAGIIFLVAAFFSSGKKPYIYLLLFCTLTSLLFLDIIPGYGLDFDRYMQITSSLKFIKISSLHDLYEFYKVNAMNETNNYLFMLIQYFCSKFKVGNLLSVISVFLSSFFCIFPFLDIVQKEDKHRFLALCLGFICLNILGYGYMASVMRWSLAVTSCLFVNYLFFIRLKEKKKWAFLLLIPLLFHLGIILAVVMSFFVLVAKRVRLSELIIYIICVLVFLFTSINGSNSTDLTGQLLNTTKIYSKNFLASGQTRNAVILNIVIYTAYIILILINIVIHRLSPDVINPFTNLSILAIISTLLLSTRYLILIRFISLATFFIAVDILLTVANENHFINFSEGKGLLVSLLFAFDIFISFIFGYASFCQFTFPVGSLRIWFVSIFYLINHAILIG